MQDEVSIRRGIFEEKLGTTVTSAQELPIEQRTRKNLQSFIQCQQEEEKGMLAENLVTIRKLIEPYHSHMQQVWREVAKGTPTPKAYLALDCIETIKDFDRVFAEEEDLAQIDDKIKALLKRRWESLLSHTLFGYLQFPEGCMNQFCFILSGRRYDQIIPSLDTRGCEFTGVLPRTLSKDYILSEDGRSLIDVAQCLKQAENACGLTANRQPPLHHTMPRFQQLTMIEMLVVFIKSVDPKWHKALVLEREHHGEPLDDRLDQRLKNRPADLGNLLERACARLEVEIRDLNEKEKYVRRLLNLDPIKTTRFIKKLKERTDEINTDLMRSDTDMHTSIQQLFTSSIGELTDDKGSESLPTHLTINLAARLFAIRTPNHWPEALSQSEHAEVVNHTLEAGQLFERVTEKVRLIVEGESIFSHMTRLIHMLDDCSASNRGSEYRAHDDINLPRLQFTAFLAAFEKQHPQFFLKFRGQLGFGADIDLLLDKNQMNAFKNKPVYEEKATSSLGVNYCIQLRHDSLKKKLENKHTQEALASVKVKFKSCGDEESLSPVSDDLDQSILLQSADEKIEASYTRCQAANRQYTEVLPPFNERAFCLYLQSPSVNDEDIVQ